MVIHSFPLALIPAIKLLFSFHVTTVLDFLLPFWPLLSPWCFLLSPAFKCQHAWDPRSSSNSTWSFNWAHVLPKILKPGLPSSRPRLNFECPEQNNLPLQVATLSFFASSIALHAQLPHQNLSHLWSHVPLFSLHWSTHLWVPHAKEMSPPTSLTSLLRAPSGYTKPGPFNWSTPTPQSFQSNHYTITKLIFLKENLILPHPFPLMVTVNKAPHTDQGPEVKPDLAHPAL